MQVNLISLFLISLLVAHSTAFQKNEELDDYGPEGGPTADDPKAGVAGKTDGESNLASVEGEKPLEETEEADPAKTKFTDDRFAKLFPSRGGGRNFVARNVAKPKPTLPSFIKSTPPLLKAQVSTTPVPRGGARARAATQATTRRTSSTTPRPQRRGNLPTQRQLSGRLSTSASSGQRPTSAPNSASASTPSAAALAAARRLRQSNGISRFQRNQAGSSNSTIPALNPRRN